MGPEKMKKLFRFGSWLSKDEAEVDYVDHNKDKLSRWTVSLRTGSSRGGLMNGKVKQNVQKGQPIKTNENNGTTDDEEREAFDRNPNLRNLPNQSHSEQIAAGWPEWLISVAGEALRGLIPKRADAFEKIDKIGEGTYSNVYKARELETGKIVALKKVRCDSREPQSVKFMAREIKILRRLNHPNVLKLEGVVTSRLSCSLYLVFEYMDNDLNGLMASLGMPFDEAQVKCLLLQILSGLDHCHSCGVLHRDLKGSNLLLDSEGDLKIADFGLATFFKPGRKQQLTSRVVTLWYRSPELLLGAKDYGFGVDLWSVGCILAELFIGRPIMAGRTEVEQLHKIFKLCGSPSKEYWNKYNYPHSAIFKSQRPYQCSMEEAFKGLPQTAVDLLYVLLSMDPDCRGSASAALKSRFFNMEPFACDPSTLPKYLSNKDQFVIGDNNVSLRKKCTRRVHRSNVPRTVRRSRTTGSVVKHEAAFDMEKPNRDAEISKRGSDEFYLPTEDPILHAEVPVDMKEVDDGISFDLLDTNFDVKDNKNKENLLSRAISQSARYDLKFQGLSENLKQQTTGLSQLSRLVAARNNGSQYFRKNHFAIKQQVKERCVSLVAEQKGWIDCSNKNQVMNGLDVDDVVDIDNDNIPQKWHNMQRQLQIQGIHGEKKVTMEQCLGLSLPLLDVAEVTFYPRGEIFQDNALPNVVSGSTCCDNEEALHSGDINITWLRTAKSHYLGERSPQF